MTIRIKNWSEFQHYKGRTPPWIKLYRKLLDDPEWFALSGDASKMLANCWLLASECDGYLPPLPTIAFRLRISEKIAKELISQLSHWLEFNASALLAPCKQDACLETETETETDKKDIGDEETVSQQTSQSVPVESPKGQPTRYSFESGIIKLNEKHFSQWQKAFSHLDLSAELIALTEWANGLGPQKWFAGVSAALAKRNREQKAKIETAKLPNPETKWRSGIEGVV